MKAVRRAVMRRVMRWFRAAVAAGDLDALDGIRARVLAAVLLAAAPMAVDRRRARRLEGTVEWRVTRPDGGASQRTMTFAAGRCRIRRAAVADPDLVLQVGIADLLSLAAGSVNGVTLVFTGRLRISGDLGLAMRLPRAFRAG